MSIQWRTWHRTKGDNLGSNRSGPSQDNFKPIQGPSTEPVLLDVRQLTRSAIRIWIQVSIYKPAALRSGFWPVLWRPCRPSQPDPLLPPQNVSPESNAPLSLSLSLRWADVSSSRRRETNPNAKVTPETLIHKTLTPTQIKKSAWCRWVGRPGGLWAAPDDHGRGDDRGLPPREGYRSRGLGARQRVPMSRF